MVSVVTFSRHSRIDGGGFPRLPLALSSPKTMLITAVPIIVAVVLRSRYLLIQKHGVTDGHVSIVANANASLVNAPVKCISHVRTAVTVHDNV